MSYANTKEEDDDNRREILDGTENEQWAQVFLFSKSMDFYDTETTQNCSPFRYRSIGKKGLVTQLIAVPSDTSDVFNDIHHTTSFLYGTYSHRYTHIITII